MSDPAPEPEAPQPLPGRPAAGGPIDDRIVDMMAFLLDTLPPEPGADR